MPQTRQEPSPDRNDDANIAQGSALSQKADNESDSSRERLLTIVSGYRANVQSFSSLVVRSKVLSGRAASVEDGFAGRLLPEMRAEGTGHYASVDGLQRTDLIYPKELQLKSQFQVDAGRVGTQFVSRQVQWDGTRSAHYMPDNKQALVTADKPDSLLDFVRPFGLGLAGPNNDRGMDVLIEKYLLGSKDVNCSVSDEVDTSGLGVTTWRVVVDELSRNLSTVYSVAPERGFLPIRMSISSSGKDILQSRIQEVMAVSSDRWLPQRVVIVANMTSPDTNGPLYFFSDVTFLEAIVDRPPNSEELLINMEPGTIVNDTIGKIKWKAGDAALNGLAQIDIREYDSGDIHRRLGPQAVPFVSSDIRLSPPESQKRSGRASWWLISANVAVVLVLFVWYRIRKLSREQ